MTTDEGQRPRGPNPLAKKESDSLPNHRIAICTDYNGAHYNGAHACP
jgi:hypothetical protein